MIYSGIDEAGLGPVLGPYCATAVTIESHEPLKEYLLEYQKKLFYVDDSKKVYQGKYGLKRLEKNVLAFYYLLKKEVPKNSLSFIPSLKSEWYKSKPVSLPIENNLEEIISNANLIESLFESKGIKLLDIKRSAVSAEGFNSLIDQFDNKSIVCQKIIEPLIYNSFINNKESNIVIDKQGGRKFYKDFLDSILQNNTTIVKEEDKHSIYKVGNSTIEFMAKADSLNFSTALASMFSKYMREIAMISFNSYWPDIKSTAGYYTDGMRFINDIKADGSFPLNSDTILRKK